MNDVAAIVLAAGLSRRMGAQNKLLQSVGGVQMVRHAVRVCADVTKRPVTVVTGHQPEQIAAALSGERVSLVHNSRYQEGHMTSVDTGLRCAPRVKTVLLALADQPFLTADAVRELLTAHRERAHGRITVPHVKGQRGNPIVIPDALRREILSDPDNLGCRKLTRTAPDRVWAYDSEDPAFVTDVDTPEDLRRAANHFDQETAQ